MKRTVLFLAALFVLFATTGTWAQTDTLKTPPVQHGKNFVDLNNDGYNDNAPDADGDGIPNGQDPDYVKPGAGQGKGVGFVDENGDGLNDNAPDADGDGIPNGQDPDYVKPQDGSGAGQGKGQGKGFGRRMHAFVDEDGDGINDRLMDADKDGIPNGKDSDWVKPQDGTGSKYGRGARMGKGFGSGRSTPTDGAGGRGQGRGGNASGKGN